jgi:hypothetical protein
VNFARRRQDFLARNVKIRNFLLHFVDRKKMSLNDSRYGIGCPIYA